MRVRPEIHGHTGASIWAVLSYLSCTIMLAMGASAREDVRGIWIDDTGKGAVELRLCGNRKQSMCGYIVWLRNPVSRSGKPLRDVLNPEPRNRKRPICGLQIIGRLKPQTNGTWDNGWIYDPKQGKAFDVELRLHDQDRLKVTGYLGIKLFSESFMWRRAPDKFERCAPKRS